MNQTEYIISQLEKELPPILSREEASKAIGRVYSPKTLSNFDSVGTGPRFKKRIGKKTVYEKYDFLDWFRNKCYQSN